MIRIEDSFFVYMFSAVSEFLFFASEIESYVSSLKFWLCEILTKFVFLSFDFVVSFYCLCVSHYNVC